MSFEFLKRIPESIGLNPEEFGSPDYNDNGEHPLERKFRLKDELIEESSNRVERKLDERFGFLDLV